MIPLRHTLFWKLSVAFLFLVVSLGALGLSIVAYFFTRTNSQLEQVLHWGAASHLSRQLAPLFDSHATFWEIQTTVDNFIASNPAHSVYLLNKSGEVIGEFGGTEILIRTAVPIEPLLTFLGNRDRRALPILNEDPRSRNEQVIFSVAPISIDGEAAYVYVTLVNDEYRRLAITYRARSALQGTIMSFTLAILGTALVGTVLFYLLTERFRKMITAVSMIEQADYSVRLPEAGNDEGALLARTINGMAAAIQSNVRELQGKDELRRQLISDISHDLRRPVSNISGFAEVMLNENSDLDETGKRQCEIILRNSEMLQRFLGQLFELARIEAREQLPSPKPFSLVALIEDLSVEYAPTCERSGVTLQLGVPPTLPAVLGDEPMILRVFSNLLDNALRYTPRGGTITLGAHEAAGRISVRISDTGIGIPAEDLPFVFQRSYQVEGEDASRPKGLTGLGLAIVKKIVESHGGTVRVESVEGAGTTFEFDLECIPNR